MQVADRIGSQGAALTTAERRVAEVVLARPQLVAFGTVAELASAAGSGAATVVRLSTKLGYDGFTALQAAVQAELAAQLRPAAERIREPAGADLTTRHQQLEVANVEASLGAVSAETLAAVVDHLADRDARVFVLSGDASRGVALQFVGDLGSLRDDVTLIDGNPVAVRRQAALLHAGDVLLTLDLRRYERWVIDVAQTARAAGVWSVALTDSVLSPLAQIADATVVLAAAGSGPFDSHTGTLAVFDLFVSAVADRLRAHATERLDRLEAVWREVLTDR
ncbi:MAG: MurR/RpiR family transcriptional regulator [Actinomycetota bacterium]